MSTNFDLGRRIIVRGVTGSGKSTLARGLGEALGLEVIELDAIHWQRPNWQPMPVEELRGAIDDALDAAPGGWVVDGNNSAASARVLMEADTLIWLHLPWRTSFFRMVRRTLRRTYTRELLWGVQQESLRTQLFSRQSLWWWGIHHHWTSVRRMQALIPMIPHIRVYELRSPAEVAELLETARSVHRR